MTATLFDSHCHLEDDRFRGEVDAVLVRMAQAGVGRCILAGSDIAGSTRIAALAAKYGNVYGVVGIHPHEAKYFDADTLGTLAGLLKQPRIIGVGEIGLDYYYDHSPREAQRDVFASQLEFAYQQGVPAVFHVRDAHGDVTDLFRGAKKTVCLKVCCTATPAALRARGNTSPWAFTFRFPDR